MQLNEIIYHPCSMDILEFKITGIHSYKTHTVYSAKATHNIGACGRIEVSLAEDQKGSLRFISLDDEQRYEYGSGLGDFTEGLYYTDKQEAKLAYYENHLTQAWTNMEHKERLYKEAKQNYEKIQNIIKVAKEDLIKPKD